MRNRVVQMSLEDIYNGVFESFALADNRSYCVSSLKADLFLSGIVQLLGVILADKINNLRLFKSIRKLFA